MRPWPGSWFGVRSRSLRASHIDASPPVRQNAPPETKLPEWAGTRNNMPVITPGDLEPVAAMRKRMAKGKLDWHAYEMTPSPCCQPDFVFVLAAEQLALSSLHTFDFAICKMSCAGRFRICLKTRRPRRLSKKRMFSQRTRQATKRRRWTAGGNIRAKYDVVIAHPLPGRRLTGIIYGCRQD